MKRRLISILMVLIHSCAAHNPTGITAKLLDEHLEIVIHHPSNDQNHYVNHVTIKRGGRIMVEQDFNAQTDTFSLEISIAHPNSPRKRMKKGALILVHATCNQGGELNQEVRVQ